MFHCAHQVTEIGVVGLIAGNMNEIGVRKVFGNSFHWVHKSEGCTKDHIEAFGCKAAEDLFLKIRPSITYFHSSKYISDLANGNICVAVGYSGDLEQSKARAHEAGDKVKLSYTIPKEGAGTFYDMVAIPKDAENVEAAYKFMDFLLQPEVMAGITNAVRFPNGNKAATPLVDKEITSDPAIYPSDEVKAKLYAIKAPEKTAQREITRSWTKIKSGK